MTGTIENYNTGNITIMKKNRRNFGQDFISEKHLQEQPF